MRKIDTADLGNKKILILGFGMEGRSTYSYLRKLMPVSVLHIADRNVVQADDQVFRGDTNIVFHCGEHYLDAISEFDIIFKTPGISLKAIDGADMSKLSSHTEIFLSMYGRQTIGITGTKGKSTTSGLIAHIISLHTDNYVLVGNIGIPPLDLAGKIDNETRIVYELSSHQLEQVSHAPHIAVLLNLYQEHLDHYESYEAYQRAKMNIAGFQQEDDIFIFNGDDDTVKHIINAMQPTAQKLVFSREQVVEAGCYLEDGYIVLRNNDGARRVIDISKPRLLAGDHNLMNIMAATAACAAAGVPDDIIETGVLSFKPLEHRMEFVAELDGVRYYDDSIATIPEAAMAAALALQPVGTMILGGFDRGVDYAGLCRFLLASEIENLIFIDTAGERMLTLFLEMGGRSESVHYVNNMREAVSLARKKTAPGKSCLLSPAAASYGMYLNFKERGNEFRKLLMEQ